MKRLSASVIGSVLFVEEFDVMKVMGRREFSLLKGIVRYSLESGKVRFIIAAAIIHTFICISDYKLHSEIEMICSLMGKIRLREE